MINPDKFNKKDINKSLFLSLLGHEKSKMFVSYSKRYITRQLTVKQQSTFNNEQQLSLPLRNLLFVAWLLTVSFVAKAQGWEQSLQPSNGQFTEGFDLAPAANGDIVAVGYANVYFPPVPEVFVTRLSPSGDLLWKKLYGDKSLPDYGTALTTLENGNHFVIAGYTLHDSLNKQAYIFRIDNDGKLQWELRFGGDGDDEINDLFPNTDSTLIVVGSSNSFGDGSMDVYMANVSVQGEVIWSTALPDAFGLDNTGQSVIQTQDGGYAIIGTAQNPNNDNSLDLYLAKVSASGSLEWDEYYGGTNLDRGFDLVELDNGDLILCGATRSFGAGSDDVYYLRTNSQGDVTWEKYWGGLTGDLGKGIVYDGNNTLAISGKSETQTIPQGNMLLLKTDLNGEPLNSFVFGGDVRDEESNALISLGDDFYALAGSNFYLPTQSSSLYVVKVDPLGNTFSNYIKGNVFVDENSDCLLDTSDRPLNRWVVSAEGVNSGNFYLSLTDLQGNYAMTVDTGTFDVKVYPEHALWEPCFTTQTVQFSSFYDSATVNIPVQATFSCPLMTVEIETGQVRKCGQPTYYIDYCNDGSTTATDAFIEVVLDNDFSPLSASPINWSAQVGDTLYFDIGDVLPGDCGNISLQVELSCDGTISGQTHCVSAHIYPDTFCLDPDPLWEGAEISVRGNCENDGKITFEVENTGTATLTNASALQFIIVEDDVIFMTQPFPDSLPVSESLDTSFLAFGSTYRIIADQAPGYPFNCSPTLAIEGCRPDTTDNFTTGFVNQFPEADCAPYLAYSCEESISALESNTKRGYPKGITDSLHLITDFTDLEYKIIYQNVGTDTAIKVVIRDTLQIPELDLSTLKIATYSHEPKTVQLKGNGELYILIDNLNLPPVDSSVNELDSYGFITFRLSQKPLNPQGTVINNNAAIYFDYNTPILTNTVFHTVGGSKYIEFVDSIIVSIETIEPEIFDVMIYPNPISQTATFEIVLNPSSHPKTVASTQKHLILLEPTGRRVKSIPFDGNVLHFRREGLTAGLYFFQIVDESGKIISVGKIIAQ